MRRFRPAALAPALLAIAVAVAGCGVQPSEVTAEGESPTGVAAGPTLYFVDADGALRPDLRDTGRLGTIAEALTLLLTGPGDGELRTEIDASTTRVVVTETGSAVELMVPLTIDDVTPAGIDQIVCTALGVHVQAGGSTDTTVRIRFVQPTPESDERRGCPLISPAR